MVSLPLRKYGQYLVIGGVVLAGAWLARPRVDVPAPPVDATVHARHSLPMSRTTEAPSPQSSGAREMAADGPALVEHASPHPLPNTGGDGVPVGKVKKANGEQGRTVAEIYAERRKLRGQKVRVRGVVVKRVAGVLNRVFVHVRDGSGQAKNGDHDLTVTTTVEPTVGTTMLYEGTVTMDKDFGAGYTYPVMVEDAVSVQE